ncbi:transposase [Mesobacillus foraminis]|nr:transposase [Mesobacillus foraminis]
MLYKIRTEGFGLFLQSISEIKKKQSMYKVMVCMKPKGHFWSNLAYILKENGIKFVAVNPVHVKKSKELDDKSPSKNNPKH